MYKNRPCVGQGTAPKNSNVRGDHVIQIIFLYVTGSAKTAQEFKFFFLTQLIAILNSYPYTMSPVARLRWSAFLRVGFTAL